MSDPEAQLKEQVHATETGERPLWLAIVGAVIGAASGYVAFELILKYGSLYALVLPGTFIGLARGFASKKVSILLGIACGVVALAMSIWLEWNYAVRPDGQTVINFLFRIHERPFRNVASIVAGTMIAVWFGVGRRAHNVSKATNG